jgi:hypothetical protein
MVQGQKSGFRSHSGTRGTGICYFAFSQRFPCYLQVEQLFAAQVGAQLLPPTAVEAPPGPAERAEKVD